MTRREEIARWIAVGYIALSFYVTGALAVENDANYATWHLVGEAELPAFHRALEAQLTIVMFAPMALHLVLAVALVAVRPRAIPLGLALAALALNAYVIVESALVQVPIHAALSEAKRPELIERLITTHRWYRLPAELAACAVALVMLARMTRRAPDRADRDPLGLGERGDLRAPGGL